MPTMLRRGGFSQPPAFVRPVAASQTMRASRQCRWSFCFGNSGSGGLTPRAVAPSSPALSPRVRTPGRRRRGRPGRPHAGCLPWRGVRRAGDVINTHLHFDHCGGNRLFAGVPIYVQRAEREAAREPDYTIPEWAEFEGATYEEVDGEAEILPGIRVVPTPGHTPGHQSVLVDTEDGLVVVAGDVGYTWKQFDESPAGQALNAMRPRRIWTANV